MAQNIRITVTPDIEKALDLLRKATSSTLNTTELIKFAIGKTAATIQANKLNYTYPSPIESRYILADGLNKSVVDNDLDNFSDPIDK